MEPRLALSGVDAVFDLSAPPDPPTWFVAPYASGDTSSYSITMAIQPVSGLEYYFQNVTDTSHHSTDWQSAVTYVDQGLSANTLYAYQVKARVVGDTAESDYSATASATTFTVTEASVMRLANEIRAIESFSNPNNPGQVYQALVKNDFPNPEAANKASQVSATNGLAAYPGDARNTPGAFQVDLGNMGRYDSSNPALEQFGYWNQVVMTKKDEGLYDTQFAFSQSTLQDFFGITVSNAGLITNIGAAAASVFLHDDALAYSTTWVSTDNQLIGLHIDAFQSEQLSLYLAGRDPGDALSGVTDSRTSPPNVMALAEPLQYQVCKSFMYATIQKYKTHSGRKPMYDNIHQLFGAELDITSSQEAFGVKIGDVFKCRLNDLFLVGGTYVSGEGTVYVLMEKIWEAYENGTATWNIGTKPIIITRDSAAGQLSGAKFSFSGTPQNVDPSYPSVLHYAGLFSSLPSVDFDDKASWGIVDDGSRHITNPNELGYTRLATTAVAQSEELTTGGIYAYNNFASGQTLTLTGADDFMILPTTTCTITSEGYLKQVLNNNQHLPAGRQIDISDFVGKTGYGVNNAEEILQSSFYSWWDGTQKMVRVNDPSVPDNKEILFYFMPAAMDQGPQYVLDHIDDLWDASQPYAHSARMTVANVDVLGRAPTAEQWAANFITTAAGKGVIDASRTTGDVWIVVDNSIQQVLLGSGKTTVIQTGTNTSQKTYVLNANATSAPTLDIRSGDVIDWSNLTQGLTWAGGAALSYDNKASYAPYNTTNLPYRHFSYYTSWTGKDTALATQGAFQAIVHSQLNTAETDDPVKIVQYALNPSKVTINRATAQSAQTSASLLNFTVVFNEAMADFNEDDVTLSGPAATLDGADIAVTNPSGDQMTFTVAVTLKDTAAMGNVTSTIGGGKVHDADGFTNLPSTSTYNIVAYVPNTITGRESSGSELLPGVLVSLASSTPGFATRTTTTDGDGAYRFVVPDGTYQVTATPPNACINTGSNTTTVSTESSQTYEADFTVGALKPGCIPNRMMVTSSLPVSSVHWRQVVQEALNLGGQSSSQGAQASVAASSQPAVVQYLSLAPAPRIASVAPNTPVADADDATPVNAAGVWVESQPRPITQAAIAPIVHEAIARWEAAGLDQAALNKMQSTAFVVSDLAGFHLGMTQNNTVWLDFDAVGRGWFVDSTPDKDEEFGSAVAGGSLRAVDPQALDRIDLLTVVAHELGHVAGLKDSDIGDLMGPTLQMGLRLAPSVHDAALASL